jgi:hypothetical protein
MLLIFQDETNFYKIKNFDLGATGNLSGAYMFNIYVRALSGVKYEYGSPM